MQLTAQELGLINFAMRKTIEMVNGVTPSGVSMKVFQDRKFSDPELDTALSIFKKLKTCVNPDNNFTDSEIELGTEEKKMLLDLLKRPWGLEEGEIYQSIKPKLE